VFDALFGEVDLVVLPTTPTTAFRLGEKAQDPLAMYLADVFTVFANLIGGPGLSAPWSRDERGLPVGVQLMAAPWREDLLFRAAGALEAARRDPGLPPRPGAAP
jgi:aspartyl-tRNA(Asn)/glutamyl-tRNA(Gln) amidotransferase subunit A